MRRRLKPTLVLLGAALLAAILSVAAAGRPTTPAASPRVVVVKRGVIGGGADSSYAEYGLVLRNSSRVKDALNVVVRVKAVDAQRRALVTDTQRVSLIPAGRSSYLPAPWSGASRSL
jgi:hypothetical protein